MSGLVPIEHWESLRNYRVGKVATAMFPVFSEVANCDNIDPARSEEAVGEKRLALPQQ